MTVRVPWFDVARGICILLVVIGHVYESLTTERILISRVGQWFLYSIYTFHVPALFFLAGLNFNIMATSKYVSILNTLSRIAVPYVLWSYLQGGLMAIVPGTHLNIGWSELLFIPILPQAQLWFLWSLALFRVISVVVPLTILNVLAMLAVLASFLGDRTEITWRSAYYFFFFVAGLGLDRVAVSKIVQSSRTNSITPIVILLLPACIFITGTLDGLARYSALSLVPAILGTMAVMLASALINDCRPLAYLGRNSLAILAMHVIAGGAVRILLLSSDLNLPHIWLMSAVFLAAILGPIVVIRVLDFYNLSHIVGFDDRIRSRSLRKSYKS